MYLKWLETKFKELGGTIEQRMIRDIKVFADQNKDVDVLINCAGQYIYSPIEKMELVFYQNLKKFSKNENFYS